ncbi:MAG TPA: site-2 protease family protein, partial [Pyrinomonadaceae bacterium]|nr:site-2 protease family protein [Pyrinomonadaceae bacterium]
MRTHIKFGTILGIEIGIHYSWLIIAVLITLSLGGYFGQSHPEWGSGVIWAMAAGSAVMFFAAIVIHEMSHALVARAYDIPVKSITLFALGGVAQIEKDAETAATEFWIGIVGPITSAVIGGLCLAAAFLLGWSFGADTSTPLMAGFVWLGYINIALAVFNMVPGFPMDGGRVMRAAIWAFVKDRERATKAASLIGQTIAFGFIIFGIIAFFRGSGIGGLW